MRRMLGLMAVLLVAGACHDDENVDPTVPTEMLPVSGDAQFADAGTAVPEPLVVVVHNMDGDPVAGVTVEWFTNNVGAMLSAQETTTDANGRAQVTWVLGPTAGPQSASAVNNVLVGSPVNFSATARPAGGGGGGGGGGENP